MTRLENAIAVLYRQGLVTVDEVSAIIGAVTTMQKVFDGIPADKDVFTVDYGTAGVEGLRRLSEPSRHWSLQRSNEPKRFGNSIVFS